jgi:DHA1 family multidrug resistance protein-like MFS transporter
VTRNQVAVTAASFVGFASFTLVMPFLPLYFEQLGVDDPGAISIWSGLSLGVTPAVTAALAPMWARAADRYGRKLMVARSLASFVVIMALMAFVEAPWQVFALRTVQGLFAGYGAIALTMAADSATPESMATAIGWVQTAQRLGPAVGPVIGGVLAQAVGLRGAFLVSASVYLAAFLLVVIGYQEVRDRRPVGETRAPAERITFAALRGTPHFLLFVIAIFGLQMADRSFGPILPLYLVETGSAPGSVPLLGGIIFTTTAIAAAAGNQACGFLLARWGPASLVPAMTGLAALAAAGFGLASAVGVLLVMAAAFGFGLGVATTATYTAATRSVPEAWRSMAFGYLMRAYLIGLAVSPVIAGFVGSVSMRAVFLADAIGLCVLAWTIRKKMA